MPNVSVFFNSSFVDTGGSDSSEAGNLVATFTQQGNTVATYTATDAAGTQLAFAGQDVVAIPEFEQGDFLPDVATAAVYRDFVQSGGSLIIFSDYFGNGAATFLNSVFDYDLLETGSTSSGTASLTDAAAETAFLGLSATLPANNGSNFLDGSRLPANATAIYANGAGNALLASFAEGAGSVYYFGWDWFNAAPQGSRDGGWLDALSVATTAADFSGEIIEGTDGPDTLAGTDERDRILALAGNDLVTAQGGNDTVLGGAGDDTLQGQDGVDVLFGGDGADLLDGGNDTDLLYGEGGDDTLQGGGGNDQLTGGLDADSLIGGDGDDTLTGDEGDDTLQGDDGNDQLTGGLDADSLVGGEGDDTLSGDEGDDTLQGDDGNDQLTGGLGADSLVGGAGDDTLFGQEGDDTLQGGDGNDQLTGGLGVDSLVGGLGQDTYFQIDETDIIVETGDDIDTVVLAMQRFDGADYGMIENITANGSGMIVLAGDGENVLIGGDSGRQYLDGGLGDDTMQGGAGSDIYFVRDAGDVIIEIRASSGGIDKVKSSISYMLDLGLEDLFLRGTDNLNGVGSGRDNVLVGNAGDNFLIGRHGEDTLTGGAGNDTFVFDRLTRVGDLIETDTITDFTSGSDVILIKSSLFSDLGAAPLDPGAVSLDGTLGDGTMFLYSSDTGRLEYVGDDASGPGTLFDLGVGTELSVDDILIF